MATIEEIRGLIPRVDQLEAKVNKLIVRDGYTYVTRDQGELLRIDPQGKMERLQENTVLTEDGSYQWFYYWKPCEIISYERWQELKKEEERRNQEYEAKNRPMHVSELPF